MNTAHSHTEASETAQPETYYPLEEARPLSQSVLWSLQRAYFERAGIAAWSAGAVPMWVTSNPFIAAAYARVARAFLHDWQAGPGGTSLDPEQPVYILELGAGAGRFAYHFLRRLTASSSSAALDALSPDSDRPAIKYVMTEYNAALLEFWETHPALQPLVAAGRLDFARFDAEQPAELVLRHAGTRLAPGSLNNPLILVANYFFDSIPQDAFYLEDGRLNESLVSVLAPRTEAERDDPSLLQRVRLAYERRPVAGSYYGDGELDGLLDDYRQLLSGTALAFPCAALRCLEFMRRLPACAGGHGGVLLLSADKGYHRLEDLQGRREPGFEVHGSFSMGVNYHALEQYFVRHGGLALYVPHRHLYLEACAFVLGKPAGAFTETRQAYDEAIGEFGPEDFYLLQSMLDAEHTPLTADQSLAMLRLSRWDPKIFQSCFADLLAGAPSASLAVKEELREGTSRLWDNYFPIGEQYDLPYDLGVLLYKLGDYARAVEYFERSLALHGREPKTLYNLSLCYYCLRDLPAALRSATQAALLDPGFEAARAMVRKLQAEL